MERDESGDLSFHFVAVFELLKKVATDGRTVVRWSKKKSGVE